jgi:hypothetical protein
VFLHYFTQRPGNRSAPAGRHGNHPHCSAAGSLAPVFIIAIELFIKINI